MTPNIKKKQPALTNRERIITAAIKAFEDYGYRKTTVQDICKLADLSKPTFYNNFTDKMELLVQLFIKLGEDAFQTWTESGKNSGTPAQRLVSFVDLYVDVFTTQKIYFTIFEDFELMKKAASAIMTRHDSPILREVRQIIEDGCQSGQFRNLEPETGVILIYALLDSMFFFLPTMYRQPNPQEKVQLTEEIKKFILFGMGATNENN